MEILFYPHTLQVGYASGLQELKKFYICAQYIWPV